MSESSSSLSAPAFVPDPLEHPAPGDSSYAIPYITSVQIFSTRPNQPMRARVVLTKARLLDNGQMELSPRPPVAISISDLVAANAKAPGVIQAIEALRTAAVQLAIAAGEFQAAPAGG
jgi:hypothetical protein